jgi:flagellar hook-length control protein FliK
MPMFAMTDGLPQEHRLSALSGKAGFESDQGLYSNQGLDMTSQANQTAANLGISASIPIDAAPETAVATQVAVWVSQNIQSAELKLDAQGSDPVEVSISMVGNQATVEFRCDTAETRDMLNRAADQLDTMLKSEGLILSGVSVGTSSQQQARDRSSEPSQSDIQRTGRGLASRSAGAPDQTIHVVQRSRVVDGAVDIFV